MTSLRMSVCRLLWSGVLLFVLLSTSWSGVQAAESSLEQATNIMDRGENHREDGESHDDAKEGSSSSGSHSSEEHNEPFDALLFPFFMLIVGVVGHFLLSRYAEWLPHTAFMFLFGTAIGVTAALNDDSDSLLFISISDFWANIDGELLLVSFLPGLIYFDASNQSTYLFEVAFAQCVIFAFPMVLAGTVLTALVAFHIFPYGWSFNLSMTFGSILAATDPVAVAALLDTVGAPPRLKVHIAGESLLNDGSAIVFFNIFSSLFLLELGVPGVGEEVDWGEGFIIFFRKSLGAFCIGTFFALGFLPLMSSFTRALEREENVVQTAATITVAYLCYITAEVAWETSGVIAVLTMGVLSRAFGQTYINDNELLENFWKIIEWLLNTILFGLGGLLWGSVIAQSDSEIPEAEFSGRDWGYLVVIYLMLTAIRFGLFAIAFPITSRIGLKSNWKEMVFQSFGGLRGAVGISLAIFLDNDVRRYRNDIDHKFILQTNKIYGFVGGIAFLTLMVNGVMAGPLLKFLGLADVTETRKCMLERYRLNFREHAIDSFVRILGHDRFSKVNFNLVRAHCPYLRDLTMIELVHAVERYQKIHQGTGKHFDADTEPDLSAMEEYLGVMGRPEEKQEQSSTAAATDNNNTTTKTTAAAESTFTPVNLNGKLPPKAFTLHEVRRLYLELVRAGYHNQIKEGELQRREFVANSLFQSLDLAAEAVDNGSELNDWTFIDSGRLSLEERFRHSLLIFNRISCIHKWTSAHSTHHNDLGETVEFTTLRDRSKVERALAFINAHKRAAYILQDEFHIHTGKSNSAIDHDLDEAEDTVLSESEAQVKLAAEYLQSLPHEEVEFVVSHKVSKMILNKAVHYIEELVESGLVKEQEAGEFLEEIQHSIDHVDKCLGACRLSDFKRSTVGGEKLNNKMNEFRKKESNRHFEVDKDDSDTQSSEARRQPTIMEEPEVNEDEAVELVKKESSDEEDYTGIRKKLYSRLAKGAEGSGAYDDGDSEYLAI